MQLSSIRKQFRDSLSSVISFPADYFAGWFGVAPSESGVEVNELTAMQIAAYVGCVRVLSDAVSSTPFTVMETLKSGSVREAPDHPVNELIGFQPNKECSAADYYSTLMVHICLTGNSIAEAAFNGAGQPAAIFLRNPFRTFPYRMGTGELFYKTNDTPTGYERNIYAENVVHVKGLGMDSLLGLSPVKYWAREVLGTDLAAQSYSAKFFANDSRPGGYLTAPGFLDKEKREKAINSWMAGHSRGQAHRVALLDGGWKWEQTGIPPEEAQFLQTREFNRTQIAGMFGVPPHFLGEAAESRANMEQRALEFLTFTMRPWYRRIELAHNIRLFPRNGRNAGRYFCKFNTTHFERATYADLLKGVQMGRYAGIYTIDEGRAMLGEQPYTDEQMDSPRIGDKLWQPVNMVVVTKSLLDGTPPGGGDAGEGQGGNDQAGGDGAGSGASSSTTQGGKRSADAEIKHYFALFYPTFRDAFGRVLARRRADRKDFERVFSPVLIQIASAFGFEPDSEPGDMTLSEPNVRFIRDYCAGLQHRSPKWNREPDGLDRDAATELTRAIAELRKQCKPAPTDDDEADPQGEE